MISVCPICDEDLWETEVELEVSDGPSSKRAKLSEDNVPTPKDTGGVSATPCGHIMHRKCLEDWFRNQLTRNGKRLRKNQRLQGTCPVCRLHVHEKKLLKIFPPGQEKGNTTGQTIDDDASVWKKKCELLQQQLKTRSGQKSSSTPTKGQLSSSAASAKGQPSPSSSASAKGQPSPSSSASAKGRPSPSSVARAKGQPSPSSSASTKDQPSPGGPSDAAAATSSLRSLFNIWFKN